jgi:threonine aldolase
MAQKMRDIFKRKGYEFYIETSTNQIFIVLEDKHMEDLSKKVAFSFWERLDESHCVVRFATSWATAEADVDELNKIL